MKRSSTKETPRSAAWSADSKHIMDGDMFICFKGGDSDGHDFAAEAVAAGAVAVVCERECDLPVCQIVVKNGRRAMSEFARAFTAILRRK